MPEEQAAVAETPVPTLEPITLPSEPGVYWGIVRFKRIARIENPAAYSPENPIAKPYDVPDTPNALIQLYESVSMQTPQGIVSVPTKIRAVAIPQGEESPVVERWVPIEVSAIVKIGPKVDR